MIQRFLIPVLAALAGLYVIVQILTSGGNALSEAMIYLAIFGFIIAIANAKAGMAFVFLCANYLDVLKRFLIVGGSPTMEDVIRTLAVAPVATGAVYIGLCMRSLSKKGDPLPLLRIALAFVLAMAVVGSALASGGTTRDILQSVANSALYVGLMGFASSIYKTSDDQHKLWRFLMVIFLPVVVYGWVQLIDGYTFIEVEYAKSGLTMIDVPLLHPSEIEYKRVFSTMSSSPAYTIIGTIISLYALIYGFGRGIIKRAAGVLFALFCLASHVPGAGRTGWAIAICALGCYFVFRSKLLTIVTYVVSIISTILFLFNAEKVGLWLVEKTQGMGNSEFGDRATTMGTFTTRTQGIDEWFGNPQYFSWFGLPWKEVKASKVHDMFGQIYLSTGVVGTTAGIIGGFSILFYLHKNLLAVSSPENKKLGAFYLALIFSILFSGVFSGSQFHVFPINIYFWLMLGLLFQIITNTTATEKHVTPSDANSNLPDHNARLAN